MEEKRFEELRCLRCVLERILRVMDEGLFVDYQMEKFGKNYKTRERGAVIDCPKCHSEMIDTYCPSCCVNGYLCDVCSYEEPEHCNCKEGEVIK